MTPGADLDPARPCVLLDLRHPLAFLALHPTLALADELGIDFDWLPLEVPPLRPPAEPREGDDRGARHRRFRALAIRREIEIYSRAQGLALRDPYRDGAADAAKLGWLWLRDRDPGRLRGYLVELFRAFWAGELDPSDPEQVSDRVEAAGGDAAAFGAWSRSDGPREARALAEALRARGLFQVPAIVVGDEVFYGRQHLPMIRWILEGRTGPVPI